MGLRPPPADALTISHLVAPPLRSAVRLAGLFCTLLASGLVLGVRSVRTPPSPVAVATRAASCAVAVPGRAAAGGG